jgi:uncharacterized protein YuzE
MNWTWASPKKDKNALNDEIRIKYDENMVIAGVFIA